MVNSLFFAIKKYRFDLVKKAVQLFIDNPYFSNCEVARQVGVGENAIRRWKQQAFWEQERQKILAERIEVIKIMAKRNQEEYIKELEQEQRDLKKLRDAVKFGAARKNKIANASLANLDRYSDPTKACNDMTKKGTLLVSEKAAKDVEMLVRINKDLYEFDLIINFLRDSEDEEDDEEEE